MTTPTPKHRGATQPAASVRFLPLSAAESHVGLVRAEGALAGLSALDLLRDIRDGLAFTVYTPNAQDMLVAAADLRLARDQVAFRRGLRQPAEVA